MLKHAPINRLIAVMLAATLFIIYLWQSNLSHIPYMFCDEELFWGVAQDINRGIHRTAWNFIYSGSGLVYRIFNPFLTELKPSIEGVNVDYFNRAPFYFLNIFCSYIFLWLTAIKFLDSKLKAAICPIILFLSPYLLANMFYVYQDQGSLFFSAAYLYFAITYWKEEKSRYLVLSGLFGGFLAACKPHFAILILLILLITLAKYLTDINKNLRSLLYSLALISLFFIMGLLISSPEYILQPKFMYEGILANSQLLYKASPSNIYISLLAYIALSIAAFGPLFLLTLVTLKNELNNLTYPIFITLSCYILMLSFGNLVLFRNLVVLTPFAFILFMITIGSCRKGGKLFLFNSLFLAPFSILILFNSLYSQNTRLAASEYLLSIKMLDYPAIDYVYFTKPCMGEKNPAEVVFKDFKNLHPITNNFNPILLKEKTLIVSDSWADGEQKSIYKILDWRDIHFEIFNLRNAFTANGSLKSVQEKYLIHSIDYGAGPKYKFYYIPKE